MAPSGLSASPDLATPASGSTSGPAATSVADPVDSPGTRPNDVTFLAGLLMALLSGDDGFPPPLPPHFSAALLQPDPGGASRSPRERINPLLRQGVPAYPLYECLAQRLRDWIVTGDFPQSFEPVHGIAEAGERVYKIAPWSIHVQELGSLLSNCHQAVSASLHVQEPYFSQLKAGTKIVEGRCASGAYNRLRAGDGLLVNQCFVLMVEDVKRYRTFLEMLNAEGLGNVLPNVTSLEEGVKVYRAFYSEERERAGVLAIRVCHPRDSRQPIAVLYDLLKEIDVGGVRMLLGMRSTMGSIEAALPPPTSALLSSFSFAHHSDLPGSNLTVGARALAKHVHRSSDGWWGTFTGTEANKNELAYNKIRGMIDKAIWLNVHKVSVPVFELRVSDGYGARWSADGYQFRGFLEPPMEEGYLHKWRH